MSFKAKNWRPSKENSWSYLVEERSTHVFSLAFHRAGKKLTASTRSRLTSLGVNATGRLYKSIGYSTADGVVSDAVKPEDMLPATSNPYKFIFGAGVPYGWYVQEGSAPATPSGDGYPWGEFQIWANARGIPKEDAWPIYKSVMKHGRRAASGNFMPSDAEVEEKVMDALESSISFLWADLPPIEIEVAL